MKKLLMLIITAIASVVLLFPAPALAQNPNPVFLSVLLEGQTNSHGRFTITYPYSAQPGACGSALIAGATVAIQNSGNGAWYTLADQNENVQAIAWADGRISGYFNLPDYENQPVRVILFLARHAC